MDVYQICNAYECEQCAGLDIPSYGHEAHKEHMIKCVDTYPDQYVWPRRCMDGWEECENGEDENPATCDVGTTMYPFTTKGYHGYDVWNGDPNVATWTGYGGFKSDPPKKGDFDKMFDDHYETYWQGDDDVQNRVEIVFHNPIKFIKMILVAQPSSVKDSDMERYQNLCFYLDDVLSGCTKSNRQTERGEQLVFETGSVETISKVEVRFSDFRKIVSGKLAELRIFHQTG